MRYPVVLLDVGETLIGPRRSYGSVYARILDTLGLRFEDVLLDGCIQRTAAEMKRLIPAGADRFSHFPGGEQEFWRRFLRKVLDLAGAGEVTPQFLDDGLERLREAFRQPSAWVVYADVPPALQSLRDAGVRLGIVSNWDSRLPGLLSTLGLASFFDVVGVSHLERVEKPDPALFLRVLERLGARPEQALHVGNVPELDLAGARAAGIDGLLVDRAGTLDRSLGAIPDLGPLPGVVGA